MQVNLSPGTGPAASAGGTHTSIQPDLAQLFERSPEAQLRRAQQFDERAAQRRRKDAEYHDLIAGAATATRPSDVMLQAERQMRPGSRAAQREQTQAKTQDGLRQDHRDFRQALADAAARGKAGGHTAQTTSTGSGQAGAAATEAAAATSGTPAADGAAETGTAPTGTPATGTPHTANLAAPGGKSATEAAAGNPAPATLEAKAIANAALFAGAPRPPTTAVSPTINASEHANLTHPVTTASRAAAVAAVNPKNDAALGTHGPSQSAAERTGPAAAAISDVSRSGAAARKVRAATATVAEPESGNSDVNVERMVRLIQSRLGRDRSVATLRLDPPELGKVLLRMELQHDQLALQIDADSPAAQRLLADQVDGLRRSLDAAGIRLERVEVRVANLAQPSPEQGQPPQAGWTGGQSTGRGAGSAGGSAEPGSGSVAADAGSSAAASVEPAAESLVNVWA
jgi:flagellar hook-length control protein FliK